MYSPYLELAKEDKRPKKSYGKVLIYWFAFFLVFSFILGTIIENFQLSILENDTSKPNSMNYYHFSFILCSFLISIFLLIFYKVNNRKIITLINNKELIRYKKIIYSFLIWFILYGITSITGFLIDPSKYHLERSIIDWLSIDLLLLLISTIITIIFFSFIVGYILQGISLIISKPLYLCVTISILLGLVSISSAEYFNWIQSFIRTFCYTFLYLWLIYKDNGIEVLLGSMLAVNIFGLIIQAEDNLMFTDFSPLFTYIPAPSSTINFILSLVLCFAFYLIYMRLAHQPE